MSPQPRTPVVPEEIPSVLLHTASREMNGHGRSLDVELPSAPPQAQQQSGPTTLGDAFRDLEEAIKTVNKCVEEFNEIKVEISNLEDELNNCNNRLINAKQKLDLARESKDFSKLRLLRVAD